MARKARKQEPPENHERWLITYSDLITLLLIFFIIMYAMSKIDTEKYSVLVHALNFEFKKADSIMQQSSSVIGKVEPGKSKDGTDSKTQQDTQLTKIQQQEKDLQQLTQVIDQYVKDHQLQSQVSVTNTPRGVAVTLNDLFLFDLGKADLKPGALEILDKLASLLPTLNAKISIEGHTDNLPLATGSIYKDNWGLSQARSLSVLRYFIYNSRLDPGKMISTAYADTMPVADNTTEANRAKNRRVEIVVLREVQPAKP